MNILIAVDKNYLPKAEVMLTSLSSAVGEEITVYLLASRLSENDIVNFKDNLKKKINIDVVYIHIEENIFSAMPISKFSVEMYYRIIAHHILPDNIDRILWLDADIIILKDITDFYYQGFDGCYMVVCKDVNYKSERIAELKKRVGIIDKHDYFNSGVLLMDLQKLRYDMPIEYIMKVCNDKKEMVKYPDQDILNYLYQSTVKYADEQIYNYQLSTTRKTLNNSIIENIAVLHYSGDKPWKITGIDGNAKYYWRVYAANAHRMERLYKYVIGYIFHISNRIFRKIVYVFGNKEKRIKQL